MTLQSTIPVQSCPTLTVHVAPRLRQAAWPDTQESPLPPRESWELLVQPCLSAPIPDSKRSRECRLPASSRRELVPGSLKAQSRRSTKDRKTSPGRLTFTKFLIPACLLRKPRIEAFRTFLYARRWDVCYLSGAICAVRPTLGLVVSILRSTNELPHQEAQLLLGNFCTSESAQNAK